LITLNSYFLKLNGTMAPYTWADYSTILYTTKYFTLHTIRAA